MSLPTPEEFSQLCIDLEHWETDPWAAEAILKHEILTKWVVDPCAGAGVLSIAAARAGYSVLAYDIYDWGHPLVDVQNFLDRTDRLDGCTVFMNPPFSLAVAFVEKAFELGARKVVCFQRFAWRESNVRRDFWEKNPPNRIYICGDRADCWRHDLKPDAKGHRYNPKTGKKMEGTPTAHAFFVWEQGQPAGTLTSAIYRPRLDKKLQTA